jgi:uncharacterized SAM-binding protein YcdF (DUF218 family)
LGKPVVATALPEIVAFNQENENLVLLAETQEEFIRQIKNALEEKDNNLVNLRIESAKRHSWDIRIAQMSNLIEEIIQKKKTTGYPDWQKRFRQIYRITRRRFVKVTFIFAVLWLLVFYTPLVWYLARPLKIADKPQHADAIVVFAGGVGESGKAGQGYEERVLHAVDLYKNGYAKNLIFSSGYTYALKEILIMKALAVSLGVPEQAIILEDKAKNTYENVIFTKDILNKEKQRKILLVSSPYHMRRALLIFKKEAKGIEVICTPIPYSGFYAHGAIWKQANIQQIKGILHEYLGILYYWWKGYI